MKETLSLQTFQEQKYITEKIKFIIGKYGEHGEGG